MSFPQNNNIIEEFQEYWDVTQSSNTQHPDTATIVAQFIDQLENQMEEDYTSEEMPVYNESTDDEIIYTSGSNGQPQVGLRSSLEQQNDVKANTSTNVSQPSTHVGSNSNTNPQVPQQQQTQTPTTQVKPEISPTASKLIEEVVTLMRQINVQLEKLRWEQHQLGVPLQKEPLRLLDTEQRETKMAIEWADKRLNQLLDTIILEPREMELILQLLDQLYIQHKQIDLLIQELYSLQKQTLIPCAALVIIVQPFPSSVKQNKNLDEPLAVRLLTSAKCELASPCIVKADIMNQGPVRNKRNAIGVENNEKYLSEGIASFNDIRFPNGTRLKSVQLKFNAQVNLRDQFGMIHSVPVESNASHHFIVKTNENQWFEAEGILLQETAFFGKTEITWPRFMNWLNRCYLMATRQNIQSPVRPFNTYDFAYLHNLKFDNSPVINQKQYDAFWAWFGPILHKIRYQRHICSLWTRGYICGFLTRDEVEAVLKNEKVGTFIIRFSERVSGVFAVAYQATEANGEKRVKHYLMKADDTHAAKKTLPDFLSEYQDFTTLLQIWFEPQTQRRILRRCDKDVILKEYYSKKPVSVHEGYEDQIQVKSR